MWWAGVHQKTVLPIQLSMWSLLVQHGSGFPRTSHVPPQDILLRLFQHDGCLWGSGHKGPRRWSLQLIWSRHLIIVVALDDSSKLVPCGTSGADMVNIQPTWSSGQDAPPEGIASELAQKEEATDSNVVNSSLRTVQTVLLVDMITVSPRTAKMCVRVMPPTITSSMFHCLNMVRVTLPELCLWLLLLTHVLLPAMSQTRWHHPLHPQL